MKFRIPGIIIILFYASCMNLFPQKLFYVAFDEDSGIESTIDSVSSVAIPISNHSDFPERIPGIKGNALRLDGYSTWATMDDFTISGISGRMAMEAWFAPEAFNAEKSALLSQRYDNSGFSLEIGSYGNITFVFYADGMLYELESTNRLKPYNWYHILAQADLQSGTCSLYVNGEKWSEGNLDTHSAISLASSTLYLGRHSNTIERSGFLVTAANGALDEISIFNKIFTPLEISNRYMKFADSVPDLTIDPDARFAGDYLRPVYHVMPNTSWTNEAYGLIHYNNQYHLFSQKNPNAPHLYFMHWGHYTSPDLVQWREEKIALAPAPGFDSFGVWSGTTIKDNNGRPVIVYTGVDGVKAGIGIATPEDDNLIKWSRYQENPVIPKPPPGYDHMDFRDPYVWKTDDTYYMIVGSGLTYGGGILWTYKSPNLTDWENITHLYFDNNVSRSGKFWEMPFFYRLNEKDYMLCVTPIPWQGKRAQTIYWIGSWQNEIFTPYFTEPKKFEWITENLLSPAIGTDSEGRITYIGIIPEDRDPADQIAAGWRQTLSLPRVIRLLKDTIVAHIPHPDLCRLRDDHEQITYRTIAPGTTFNTPEVSGNQTELHYRLKFDSASVFQIQVYKHEDEQEYTSIRFSTGYNYLFLDRRFSSLSNTLKDERSASYVFDHNDTLDVHIFLDHSTLEVFVDQVIVFSCRVYPSRETSNKTDLVVLNGRVEILQLDAWHLKGMREEMGNEVCEPTGLPDSIRKEPLPATGSLPHPYEHSDILSVYPNPAHDHLILHYPEYISDNSSVEMMDSTGRMVLKQPVSTKNKWDPLFIPVDIYAPGVYFIRFTTDNSVITKQIILQD